MYTMSTAARAAKFLIQYDGPVSLDVNVRSNAGGTMLGSVRWCISEAVDLVENFTMLGNKRMIRKNKYNLEQLVDLEKMLIERGAIEGVWDDEAEQFTE